MVARLPTVNGDSGIWGTLLNEFLTVAHNEDGTVKNSITTAGSPTPITRFWVGTEAQYNALTPNPSTIYFTSSGQILGISNARLSQNLKPKSRGQSVLVLQNILISKGYNIKNPNGYFGVQTTAAVKAFQRANRLVADGIVGPKTLAVLNK